MAHSVRFLVEMVISIMLNYQRVYIYIYIIYICYIHIYIYIRDPQGRSHRDFHQQQFGVDHSKCGHTIPQETLSIFK